MSNRPYEAARAAWQPEVVKPGRGGQLERALDAAVPEMAWLLPSDGAAVALVRCYARAIDASIEPEYATMKIGPHMLEALRCLCATPKERIKVIGVEKALTGRLADLRNKRGA